MGVSATQTSRTDAPADNPSVKGPDATSAKPPVPSSTTAESYKATTDPALGSRHQIAVPAHFNLPSTVPSDLVAAHETWVSDSTLPHVIHPASWTEIDRAGPWPFTSQLTYRLPESATLLTWESRKHRRQIEQELASEPPLPVRQRREALRQSAWRRVIEIHIKRWSWWAVLWFNVGSHVFLYAAISLFIPYFNTDDSVYQANTGWSSNVVACACWLAASVCELAATITASPASKWYQRPKPLLKRNQRKVDPRVYEDAYITDYSIPYAWRTVFDRFDVFIPVVRIIGVLAFLVATVSYSGAFTLTDQHRIDLVFATGIIASAMFIFVSYLSLAEVCNRWLPIRDRLSLSIARLDWWINVLQVLGSMSLLAYYIALWELPDLLDQRHGPAYPYIVFACLFTASDWLQAIEQGAVYRFELGPNAANAQQSAVLAPPADAAYDLTVVDANAANYTGPAAEYDAGNSVLHQQYEHRVDVQ